MNKEKKTDYSDVKNKIPLRNRLSFSSMVFVIVLVSALLVSISVFTYHKFILGIVDDLQQALAKTCIVMETAYPPDQIVRWNKDQEDPTYLDYIDRVEDGVIVSRGSALSIYVTGEDCKRYYNVFDQVNLGYQYRDAEDIGVTLEFDEEDQELLKSAARDADNGEWAFIYDKYAGENTKKKVVCVIHAEVAQDVDGNKVYVFYEAEEPVANIYTFANTYVGTIIMAFVVIGLLSAVSWIIFLNLKINRPISILMNENSRFARERTIPDCPLSDRIKSKSEISVLAASMDSMERDIVNNLDALLRAHSEKERLNTELSLASDIQQGTLPDVLRSKAAFPAVDLFATMDPAREVGGDFYDFFPLNDENLVLVIADVSDKGIAAALFMMLSQLVLEMQCKNEMDPGRILSNMNEEICKRNTTSNFVTVWLGVLNFKQGILTAGNAGHENPFFAMDGKDYEIYKDKHGLVIGAIEGVRYRTYTVDLGFGSSIFVYTDGLPEAINSREEQFGTARILEALNEARDLDAEETILHVKEKMDAFVGDAEQFDDTTMLCVKLKK